MRPLRFSLLFLLSLLMACEAGSVVSPTDEEASSEPFSLLSAEEVASLQFMREEEKLARDVYTFLYAEWGTQVFDNIARSEQTHTEAIRSLMEKYGVEDPAANLPAGVFADEELQALYDDLTQLGSQSEILALTVGATIEEVDIIDIQEAIDEVIVQADIATTYTNLRAGSANHLRAFVGNLELRGQPYSPQYLDPETYQALIDGE